MGQDKIEYKNEDLKSYTQYLLSRERNVFPLYSVRVKHRRDNPWNYSVKVIKRGIFKVIVSSKGVYMLDDEKIEELIKECWSAILREVLEEKTENQRGCSRTSCRS